MSQPPIDAIVALDDQRRPQPHAAELARRLGARGTLPVTVYAIPHAVTESVDVVDLIAHRDGGVMVMDAHGGGFPGDRLFDNDVEAAIACGRMPVLAIGPNAATCASPDALIIAIDRSAPHDAAIDFGARWRTTFSPADVAVIKLDAPSGWCDRDEVDDDRLGHDLDGLVEVVLTLDASRSIVATAAIHHNPVIVVAAPTSPGMGHWFATARRLIRIAPCPVVVVPNHV